MLGMYRNRLVICRVGLPLQKTHLKRDTGELASPWAGTRQTILSRFRAPALACCVVSVAVCYWQKRCLTVHGTLYVCCTAHSTYAPFVEAPMTPTENRTRHLLGLAISNQTEKEDSRPIPLTRIMNHNTYRGVDALGRYFRSHRYGGRQVLPARPWAHGATLQPRYKGADALVPGVPRAVDSDWGLAGHDKAQL
jgi:hypothetical protein